MVESLIKFGANISSIRNLNMAVKQNNETIVKSLLLNGAKVGAKAN